jgi:hypothetical protein
MWNLAIRSSELEPAFRARGFAVVDDALNPVDARALCQEIAAAGAAFKLVARSGVHPRRMVFEQPLSARQLAVLREQLAVAQRAGLLTALHDLWEPEADPSSTIARVLAELRSPRTLSWVAAVTSIRVDECQVGAVTRFRHGHYVDPHSDRLVKFGKRRKIAFVLFCSHDPALREGGSLVLLRRDGATEASIEPRVNRLALVDVERIHQHFVPEITVEGCERLAIPGFFCVTPEHGDGVTT